MEMHIIMPVDEFHAQNDVTSNFLAPNSHARIIASKCV